MAPNLSLSSNRLFRRSRLRQHSAPAPLRQCRTAANIRCRTTTSSGRPSRRQDRCESARTLLVPRSSRPYNDDTIARLGVRARCQPSSSRHSLGYLSKAPGGPAYPQETLRGSQETPARPFDAKRLVKRRRSCPLFLAGRATAYPARVLTLYDPAVVSATQLGHGSTSARASRRWALRVERAAFSTRHRDEASHEHCSAHFSCLRRGSQSGRGQSSFFMKETYGSGLGGQ